MLREAKELSRITNLTISIIIEDRTNHQVLSYHSKPNAIPSEKNTYSPENQTLLDNNNLDTFLQEHYMETIQNKSRLCSSQDIERASTSSALKNEMSCQTYTTIAQMD